MNLMDEAVILEIFGIRVYAFGLYTALGALAALITLCVMSRVFRMKQGTAPITFLLSATCGMVLSRLCFCLLDQELGMMVPLHAWICVNGGGWSMFGLIGGAFLGGWLSSLIMREKTGRILDAISLSILPFVIAERIGENRIEDFDISRALDNETLRTSFLATGEDQPVLATYYVAAAVALILFVVLMILASGAKKEGNLTVTFLLLFGASAIITESLRYDFFLSISFVGLQQVAAALTLALGVILAVRCSNRPKSALALAALISLPLMTGAVIGLEFALDRTSFNKILIYIAMVITVAVPAGLGMVLLNTGKGNERV